MENKLTGIELIAKERQEQIEKHGRTIEKDIELNDAMQLTQGAVFLFSKELGYAEDTDETPEGWDVELYKDMRSKPYEHRLKVAGALIAAELDRINS